VTLVTWDNLSPAEAATVVGLTAVGARVRLHRARRKLRQLLDEGAATPQPTRTCLPDGHPPVPAKETS
jgi:RNA polymerase sigma-70 factor (ECF subfamily)